MRTRDKICILVLAVCGIVTLLEIPNLRSVWQQAGIAGGFVEKMQGGRSYFALKESAAVTDPEAAHVWTCCTTEPNEQDLAVMLAAYPDNEFFLARLVWQLTRAELVDTRAVLAAVDRLLFLNPDNAYYHGMKGWVLCHEAQTLAQIREAVPCFQRAEAASLEYRPFELYEARVDRLCDLSRVGLFSRSQARENAHYLCFRYEDLTKTYRTWFATMESSDRVLLRDFCTALGEMSSRVIESAQDSEDLFDGTMLSGVCEGTLLNRYDLSEPEIRLRRFRASRYFASLHLGHPEMEELMTLAIVWLVLNLPGAMLMSLACLWVLVILVNAFRGRAEGPGSGPWAYLVFILGTLGFLPLVTLQFWLAEESIRLPCLFSLAGAWVLWRIIRRVSCIQLNRCMQGLLVIVFMSGLFIFVPSVFWLRTLTICVTLLLLGLAAICTPGHGLSSWHGLKRFFDRTGMIVFDRTNLVRVLSSILPVVWMILLAGIHVLAPRWSELPLMLNNSLSLYEPLPQADQATYERAILEKDQTNQSILTSPDDLPRHFNVAAPDDMGRLLAERKASGQTVSDHKLLVLCRGCGFDARDVLLAVLQDPNHPEALCRRARWDDSSVKAPLRWLFEREMTAYGIHVPRNEEASERMSDEYDPLEHASMLMEIAYCLVRLSEPEEVRAIMASLSDLMDKQAHHASQEVQTDPNSVFHGRPSSTRRFPWDLDDVEYVKERWIDILGLLPEVQAKALFKAHLQQTDYADLLGKKKIKELLLSFQMLGDREMAEHVFQKVTASAPTRKKYNVPLGVPFSDFKIIEETATEVDDSVARLRPLFHHLDKQSIPLLLRQMNGDNEAIRSFVVWRLTTLGYEWSDGELKAISQDPCWQVRLNGLFAGGSDTWTKAMNDEHCLVRATAQVLMFRSATP